jgi:hypothetical protein
MLNHLTIASSSGSVSYLWIVIAILEIVALWKVFIKAGRPGWGAIIPIYNIYLSVKVAKRPGWWWILFFIPILNIVIWFIVAIDIAKSFNKGVGFGILLAIFPTILLLILAFGSATYTFDPIAQTETA